MSFAELHHVYKPPILTYSSMKASISIGSEIEVVLKPEEVSPLERWVLHCVAKVRETELQRELMLTIAPTKNLYIDVNSFPLDACFEEITAQMIILSKAGYELLKAKGAVCDRQGGPSKVYIRVH
jgi:hypothetical protein